VVVDLYVLVVNVDVRLVLTVLFSRCCSNLFFFSRHCVHIYFRLCAYLF